jgi:ABC-type oligopeptide transport system ATPase subunit
MAFLEIKDLKKYFHLKQGMLGKVSILRAVDDVSFDVEKDTIFSVVGESGCGKSTLARMIVRLLEPTGGRISFKDNDIFQMDKEALRKFRKSVQIIFQDPYASLNPRMRVLSTIAEPLKIHKIVPVNDLKNKVAELLSSVCRHDEQISTRVQRRATTADLYRPGVKSFSRPDRCR